MVVWGGLLLWIGLQDVRPTHDTVTDCRRDYYMRQEGQFELLWAGLDFQGTKSDGVFKGRQGNKNVINVQIKWMHATDLND